MTPSTATPPVSPWTTLLQGASTIADAFVAIGGAMHWAVAEERRAMGGLEHDLEGLATRLKGWAQQQNPEPVFALLRDLKPVLVHGDFALVTRFDDVAEVLARPDVFDVPYEAKFEALTEGRNFFLGMRETPAYDRDVSLMRLAVRREDIESRIAPLVARTAAQVVARGAGRVDVVRELGTIVPETMVAEYFGLPSPQVGAFADWSSTISGWLFLARGATDEAGRRAVEQAGHMRAALAATLEARRRSGATPDDVLQRCLAQQAAGLPGTEDEALLANLFGLVVGALPTTRAVLARALDELLRRPDALEQAQRAAHAGATRLVWQLLAEMLRFNPLGPGVFRIANEDFSVGAGTRHATTIPAGSTVLVALQSAMMDGRKIDDPHLVKPDRPGWQYLHFGDGLHTCFGRYINQVQIPLMAMALLTRPNLRRAPGPDGELQLDGPFPSRLVLEYD